MSGIKAGVGLTVAASQLPKLLGVPGDPDATGFFHVLNGVLRQVGDANGATVVLSIVSVAALLAMGAAGAARSGSAHRGGGRYRADRFHRPP